MKSLLFLCVAMGDAWREICRAAQLESADLLVIGSYGHTGRVALEFDSVAERVVRHASCPVLVT